jgi:hypothetical protein
MANSRVLLFNKIAIVRYRYFAKSLLYRNLDFLGLDGTERNIIY